MATRSFDLKRLGRQIKPFRLHWYARLRSTNDHAASLRKRGELFAPAIVLTGAQIAGRGRNTNTWWSGPGSLTVTFVLPIDQHLSPHQLPLIAGLATRNALARVVGDEQIQLKWPNDLLYNGKKLAGLLCERVEKVDLVGVGVNINVDRDVPRALRARIICLEQIAGNPLDRTDVLAKIVAEFRAMILRRDEHPFGTVLREYDRHHALPGKRISVGKASGICQGLDSMGRLVIRSASGLQRIIAGQVQLH